MNHQVVKYILHTTDNSQCTKKCMNVKFNKILVLLAIEPEASRRQCTCGTCTAMNSPCFVLLPPTYLTPPLVPSQPSSPDQLHYCRHCRICKNSLSLLIFSLPWPFQRSELTQNSTYLGTNWLTTSETLKNTGCRKSA